MYLSSSVLNPDKLSSSECAACFGLYEDDLLPDGELVEGWVECTDCKNECMGSV